MDTTTNTTPEKTNLSSEDLVGGQGQESGTNSIGLGNANGYSERKKPQIRLKETGPGPLGTPEHPCSYFTFEIDGRDYSWVIADFSVLALIDNYASSCTPKREPVLRTLQIPVPSVYELRG